MFERGFLKHVRTCKDCKKRIIEIMECQRVKKLIKKGL